MRALALLVLVGCASGSTVPSTSLPLEIGVAVEDITPPVGYPMGGYFRERLSEGARDPLRARAIVLRQGEVRAALVFCDLVGISVHLSRDVRERVRQRTGIPTDSIVVAATHTHTGPLIPRGWAPPSENDEYMSGLAAALVRTVDAALADCRPSRLSAGALVQTPTISFNRRYRFRDGTVRTLGPVTRALPGHEPEKIEKPAGPIDPEIGVLLVGDPPRAALSVFALHLNTVGDTTVGDTRWSADFPCFLERDLRKAFGADFVSMFAAGPCGDINALDVSRPTMRTTEEIGSRLAATVVAGAVRLRPLGDGSLAAKSARFEWPLRRPSKEDVERARADLAKQDVPFLKRVEATGVLDLDRAAGRPWTVEVQAFRLSRDVAIVTMPGEVFAEFGLAVKRASPFRTTLVVSLANDHAPCYVPTRQAFGEGGYEVLHSRLQPGAGEKMVEEALKLLESLR
jgi:neutral ceramidase